MKFLYFVGISCQFASRPLVYWLFP